MADQIAQLTWDKCSRKAADAAAPAASAAQSAWRGTLISGAAAGSTRPGILDGSAPRPGQSRKQTMPAQTAAGRTRAAWRKDAVTPSPLSSLA